MTPNTEAELADVIKAASGPLQVKGGGTRDIGKPVDGELLRTTGLTGITLYEPGALTLVAQAGTPIATIEAALDAENQRFAFEPMDHRVLLGTSGTPTIGGVVSANVSGARRITVGACRDHLLGVRFVDGQGNIIKNGGRVMKNVTGYDLVKLMAGSYGTLGVLSEVSMKVLPKPETSMTLQLDGLSIADSVTAMSAALGSAYEISGAAMVSGVTYLRLEGFEASVAYRADQLSTLLAQYGATGRIAHAASTTLWRNITNVDVFSDHPTVTRVSVQPSVAPKVASALEGRANFDVALDWGGGLMWVGMRGDDVEAATIHQHLQQIVQREGGHATLFKASTSLRSSTPVFQPEAPTVATLSAALRTKFNPRGILNTGLMS
ncbi:FAD-binding protein [Octadecabacter sp.]|nr:FAD-binding protein [Octadecabacter sp.]